MSSRFAMSRSTRQLLSSALVVVVLLAIWLVVRDTSATPSPSVSGGTRTVQPIPSDRATPDSGLGRIAESRLPAAARHVLVLIHQGGPFRYSQDGGTFGNNEGLLPGRSRGYYKEYTVKEGTLGDRGPLRIIGGAQGDLYWTADHYASFRQIEEGS